MICGATAHLCPSCGWPLMAKWFDDARMAVVYPDGRGRYITPVKWRLLTFFRRHPGQVMEFERIYNAIYSGYENPPESNTIRVHIHHLRSDLLPTPYRIRSHRPGYTFDMEIAA